MSVKNRNYRPDHKDYLSELRRLYTGLRQEKERFSAYGIDLISTPQGQSKLAYFDEYLEAYMHEYVRTLENYQHETYFAMAVWNLSGKELTEVFNAAKAFDNLNSLDSEESVRKLRRDVSSGQCPSFYPQLMMEGA
jgi:hypothetical protein